MTHYKDWRQWPTIVVKETSILCWVRFVASTICDSTIVNEAEPTLKESALPGRAFPQHLVRGDAGETTTRSTRNESWATLILISYSRVLTPLRRYACMANVIIMLISRTLGTRPWRKLLPYMSDQFPHPQDFKDSFVLTWIKWINLKATRHIGESGTLHVRSVSSPSRWIKKWKWWWWDDDNEMKIMIMIRWWMIEWNKMLIKGGGQIVSRGLCLSGSWYNDHSQHLQHPEPSGSSSQDFNLPIQAMMNPVDFYVNRGEWTYAVKCLACSAHSEGTNNAASPARVLT